MPAGNGNDSQVGLGGSRDRNENIGEGFIGRDGFENLRSHAAFADVPFLLEVPGFDDSGPDKANVDILKELRAPAS